MKWFPISKSIKGFFLIFTLLSTTASFAAIETRWGENRPETVQKPAENSSADAAVFGLALLALASFFVSFIPFGLLMAGFAIGFSWWILRKKSNKKARGIAIGALTAGLLRFGVYLGYLILRGMM